MVLLSDGCSECVPRVWSKKTVILSLQSICLHLDQLFPAFLRVRAICSKELSNLRTMVTLIKKTLPCRDWCRGAGARHMNWTQYNEHPVACEAET